MPTSKSGSIIPTAKLGNNNAQHWRRQFIAGSVMFCRWASSNPALAIQRSPPPPTYGNNEFVQKLLERSKANKEKHDKEGKKRLDSYNKRNYTDYFKFIQRSPSENPSETEKRITKWLEENK